MYATLPSTLSTDLSTRQLEDPVGPASPIRTPQAKAGSAAAQSWRGGVPLFALFMLLHRGSTWPHSAAPCAAVLDTSSAVVGAGGVGGTRSRVLSNGFQSPSTWDRQLELRTVRQRHDNTLPHFLAEGSIACAQAISAGRVCSMSCPGGLNATPCVTCHGGHGRYLRTDSHAAPISKT